MKITFTGHQLEVTEALKKITQEKLERLERHFDRIISISVIFSVEKLVSIAEATVHVPGKSLHARSDSENMYSAIDLLVDKLDRQIKKFKETEN